MGSRKKSRSLAAVREVKLVSAKPSLYKSCTQPSSSSHTPLGAQSGQSTALPRCCSCATYPGAAGAASAKSVGSVRRSSCLQESICPCFPGLADLPHACAEKRCPGVSRLQATQQPSTCQTPGRWDLGRHAKIMSSAWAGSAAHGALSCCLWGWACMQALFRGQAPLGQGCGAVECQSASTPDHVWEQVSAQHVTITASKPLLPLF